MGFSRRLCPLKLSAEVVLGKWSHRAGIWFHWLTELQDLCTCVCGCGCVCEREREREREEEEGRKREKLYLDIYLYYRGHQNNSLLILANQRISWSRRSPLKAISGFFKRDWKGDVMETGLHFPTGCCSDVWNLNASCWPCLWNCPGPASSTSWVWHALIRTPFSWPFLETLD